jgi:hypothetical protein
VKFRIRWYGENPGEVDDPYLEVKLRHGQTGSKERMALPPFDPHPESLPISLAAHGASADFLSRFKRLPNMLQPALLNRYHRRYWLSADGLFRLTLDARLFFQVPRHPGLNMAGRFLEDSTQVLEIKYAREQEPAASSITRHFPFRLGRISKYITGMQLLHPALAEDF